MAPFPVLPVAAPRLALEDGGVAARFEFKAQVVGDERNEFGVGGLAAGGVDRVGEYAREYVDVAAVPGDLYCVADSTLHPGACGLVALRDRGIQQLGNAVYHLVVVDGEHYRGAQVVVALDVRRDSYLVDYLSDRAFQVGFVRDCLRLLAVSAQPLHTADPPASPSPLQLRR